MLLIWTNYSGNHIAALQAALIYIYMFIYITMWRHNVYSCDIFYFIVLNIGVNEKA